MNRFAFDGRHWGKQWHLDVDGTLSEWNEPEGEDEATS